MAKLEFRIMAEGFDSEILPSQLKEYLIKLSPHTNTDYIDHLSPHHLLLDIPFGGCYHFVFNQNGNLQKVYHNMSNLKHTKIHTVTLWKRHWWTA